MRTTRFWNNLHRVLSKSKDWQLILRLTKYKTPEANPLLIQQLFVEIRPITSEYSAMYAEYSKDGDRAALAAFFGQVYSLRLPSDSSIVSAEANVMFLALKFVISADQSKFMICSDYLS